jgi:hypothetical protein
MIIKFLKAAILIFLAAAPMLCEAADLSAQSEAQMYAIVIQRLLGPDDTYESPMPPEKVYIDKYLRATLSPTDMKKYIAFFDRINEVRNLPPKAIPQNPPPPPPPFPTGHGYPGGKLPPPLVMPRSTEAALRILLKLPMYDIHWLVNGRKTLRFNKPCGDIHGGGVLITLSQIGFINDQAYIEGDIFVASSVAGTTWYLFDKKGNDWELVKVIMGPIA